jgi:hypothetical protein
VAQPPRSQRQFSDASHGLGCALSKVVGFSILQAASSKELARLLKDHPHFKAPGASIEVLEFLTMPAMPQK